ncbi:hypothetical protein SDC9_183314 [bioreactor metagenome]|uniref:Uncharacterized protein n=1 Tax=bioreactor metagenome TaxID=1076179 RepID=A0A645HBS1_9ZZZZ
MGIVLTPPFADNHTDFKSLKGKTQTAGVKPVLFIRVVQAYFHNVPVTVIQSRVEIMKSTAIETFKKLFKGHIYKQPFF